jgi:protein-L-isoaspartate(D-aspartate) O-methyltransferase
LNADDRVLLVGAASGYGAALLARIAGHVTALEMDDALLVMARAAVTEGRVAFVQGPLNKGWQAGAAYDVIIIDGAVETLGADIPAQLALGGRLICGLVDNGITRLARGIRAGDAIGLVPFADIETVVLPGFDKPAGFTF